MRKLRKRAVKKLQRVHKLKAGGIHPTRMPLKNVLVGNDSKMEELKAWVFADDVGVIGIVEPGGIGKTSLLRQIQSELPLEGFKLVIYVNIKENSAMLEQVQKEIIQKLDFPWRDDASLRTRAVFNALNRNKFALLLDNVSGMLDLQSIGVPIGPESRSQNKGDKQNARTVGASDPCGTSKHNEDTTNDPMDAIDPQVDLLSGAPEQPHEPIAPEQTQVEHTSQVIDKSQQSQQGLHSSTMQQDMHVPREKKKKAIKKPPATPRIPVLRPRMNDKPGEVKDKERPPQKNRKIWVPPGASSS
ncbi:hypothetical protein J5N97_024551 [Dioscorea zingiberensis]|uniref:NB-ARC domain-containing protein n=1 Tax=Dioscorea zingiberensis TaxID=325984 RepID=A0A9D5C7N3_9LILI|nr:hypothetical protein J5N97_024551 [Dioscorea zingiberensis]